MKNNITISLDSEIVRKLKAESNYSELINEQMKGYYDVKLIENVELLTLNLAKTKEILKKERKKKRAIEEKLLKIDKKTKKIKKLFKQKGLTRAKLIEQIKARRKAENEHNFKSVQYFQTAEAEADSVLKGGDYNVK